MDILLHNQIIKLNLIIFYSDFFNSGDRPYSIVKGTCSPVSERENFLMGPKEARHLVTTEPLHPFLVSGDHQCPRTLANKIFLGGNFYFYHHFMNRGLLHPLPSYLETPSRGIPNSRNILIKCSLSLGPWIWPKLS